MPDVGRVLSTVLLGLAGATWLLMGPSNVGGPVDYMTTDGISMQPTMHRGDLVVVRVGQVGEVGDVMAYHNRLSGQRVLHRVIGAEDDRLIFKGDNNTWIDAFEPTQEDLIGTLWFRIPQAGNAVVWLQSPLHAATLVAVGILMSSLIGTRLRRPRWHGVRSSHQGSGAMRRILLGASGTFGQTALAIVLGLGLLAGGASVAAWRLPAEDAAVVRREYEHRGTFGYSAETVIPAPVSPTVAAGDEPSNGDPTELDLGTLARDPTIRALLDVPVATGDPILTNVNPSVDFTFDYTFETLIEGDVSGTVRLDAVVADITGWKRIFPFAPEQTFSGNLAHIEVQDAEVATFIAAFPAYQAITGHAPVYYTASIVAVVTLDGVLEGQAIAETFEPAVTFRIVPPYELYVETIDTREFETLGLANITTGGGESSGTPFHTSRIGAVEYPTTVPNTIPILWFEVGVSTLRVITTATAGVALLATLALLTLQRFGSRQGETFAIEAMHGSRIVLLDADQRGHTTEPTTYVARIADLVRLSEHNGSPVLSQYIDGDRVYYVREGKHLYAYVSGDST